MLGSSRAVTLSVALPKAAAARVKRNKGRSARRARQKVCSSTRGRELRARPVEANEAQTDLPKIEWQVQGWVVGSVSKDGHARPGFGQPAGGSVGVDLWL